MFYLLITIVVAILFHSLGVKKEKSPWLYSLIAVIVYFIPSVFLYFFTDLEYFATGSYFISTFEQIAIFSGLFLCYLLKLIFDNKKNEKSIIKNQDILDDGFIKD